MWELRRLPSWRLWLQKLLLPPLTHLLPWRQAERVMASHGPSMWRPVWRRNFNRIGPQSVASPNPRSASQDQCFPSPSQDSEGRLASVSQLYEHAGEQPATHHNVAGRGIMHLHPEMLLHKATCLGNQVTCMIAEYHLMSSARGPSSLSPILPAEAAALLPPIKNYVPGIAFEGCRDVRVMDRARTLRVAVWLHQLDMAVTGDGMVSETLEASQHRQGPLLESLLTPSTSNLSFQEVVDCILQENRHASEHSLNYLLARCARTRQELRQPYQGSWRV